MALAYTPVCDFDLPAINFSLLGVDGKIWTLEQCKGEKGLLVMFICNHCPYVKAIQSQLVSTIKELQAKGIGVAAIMSNDPKDYPEDSFENMQLVSQNLGYSFPYLWDETQEIAKSYGAVCTPDFFGYNAALRLQYRGRFNDAGKQAVTATTTHDLLDAMTTIAATGLGPRSQIPSMGCSIKWKQDI